MPRTLDFDDFDPAGNGVTAAWNTALVACQDMGAAELYFPDRFTFLSRPNTLPWGINLVGKGQNRSALIRGYQPATADEGFIEPDTSYINIDRIDIAAGDGTSGGCALKIKLGSAPADYGNWCWAEDVRIASDVPNANTGTFSYGVYIDGDDAAAAPQAPGHRDGSFQNCYVRVPCSAAQFYGKTVRHFDWDGYFDFDGKVIITGGAYDSQNVRITAKSPGRLFADKCVSLEAHGNWTSVEIAASVVGCDLRKSRKGGQPWIVEADECLFDHLPGDPAVFKGPHARLLQAGWKKVAA